jgi:Ca2+-binding RTX toxin-like protein
MKTRSTLRFLAFGLVALIVISTMTAVAAANTVPSTRVDSDVISFNINHLRPSACAGLTLTNLVNGSGTINGTADNDLILGRTGIDTIDGMGGNDCIVGGDGDDVVTGGGGTDVCIGGSGNDSFDQCETAIQ